MDGGSPAELFGTLFWAGDQLVIWDVNDGITSQVTAMVCGGHSGFTLNHSDIGGCTTLTSPIRTHHGNGRMYGDAAEGGVVTLGAPFGLA
ncbi:MAG: hypothetical protein RLZZ387_336 [Chloroflexota bacterium]